MEDKRTLKISWTCTIGNDRKNDGVVVAKIHEQSDNILPPDGKMVFDGLGTVARRCKPQISDDWEYDDGITPPVLFLIGNDRSNISMSTKNPQTIVNIGKMVYKLCNYFERKHFIEITTHAIEGLHNLPWECLYLREQSHAGDVFARNQSGSTAWFVAKNGLRICGDSVLFGYQNDSDEDCTIGGVLNLPNNASLSEPIVVTKKVAGEILDAIKEYNESDGFWKEKDDYGEEEDE